MQIIERNLSRTGLAILVVTSLVFMAAVFRNAWVGDDAYIIFRTIEQLFAGNGPRWNVVDRVQTFTSPLWFLLLCVPRIFNEDNYLNVVLFSLLLDAMLIILFFRFIRDLRVFVLSLLVLVISNSFMDYTTSGLEYPVIYFLCVVFFTTYIGFCKSGDSNQFAKMLFSGGLLLLSRHDLLLTVVFPVAHTCWKSWRIYGLRNIFNFSFLLFGPIVLWTLFSLFYYGVPVPNTAYAKLGIGAPHLQLLEQGAIYFLNGVYFDFISVLVMVIATIAGLSSRHTEYRVMALTIVTVSAYIIWVGGDFMSGRFYAHLVLVSVLLLARQAVEDGCPGLHPVGTAGLAAIMLVYAGFYPHTPINSSRVYDRQFVKHGISDERGFYSGFTSIWRYLDPDKPYFPVTAVYEQARQFGKNGEKHVRRGGIGIIGYAAPLDFYIDDYYALSDFFRARLPLLGDAWVIGHSPRYYPAGYIESMVEEQNLIEEPHLREYFEVVRILTQDESLFTAARLQAIARFNTGQYDHLLEQANIDRPNRDILFNNLCDHNWRDWPALKHW